MTRSCTDSTASTAKLLCRLVRTQSISRTGVKHEDKQRVVQVLRLRGNSIGIIAETKGPKGHRVQFAVSLEGGAILYRLLGKAIRGNVKKWREPAEMVWTATQE